MSQTSPAESFEEYQAQLIIRLSRSIPEAGSLVPTAWSGAQAAQAVDIMGDKGVLGQLLISEEGTLNITFSPTSLTPGLRRKFSRLVGKLEPHWDQVTVGTGQTVGTEQINLVLNLDQYLRPPIEHVASSVKVMVAFWWWNCGTVDE